MASIRAQKALANLVANGSSKAQAIRDAGYSKNTARCPSKVFGSLEAKEVIEPFLAKLEKERVRLIDNISLKNLDDVQYEAAVRSMDMITKNTQLLSGKATENVNTNICGFNLNIQNDSTI